MDIELIYGLMAALPLLPFAIASRRAGWAGMAMGCMWLGWCWAGVFWPQAFGNAANNEDGVGSGLLLGMLYAGPMLCVGLYGLASNPVARVSETNVAVAAQG